MRKITILILCAFVCYEGTFAQTNYQSQMDSIFAIPSSKVTTGLLIDRSPAVISMNGYNGDSTAVCNTKDWLSVFYRLYASYLNPADFHYDLTLANKYLYSVENNYPEKIPLGIIYYQYNKIKPFAVQDGLLSVDTINSKIIDISGAGQTPLMLDTCLAVASLIDTVRVGTNLFYIDPSLFVTNIADNIQNIKINFGDGQGFMPVSVGSTVNINYSNAGIKNLIIKVTTANQIYSVFANVVAVVEPPAAAATMDNTIPIPDYLDEYNNPGIQAHYGIWYGQNHNTIQKPILIASGFDPSDQVRISTEKPKANTVYLYNVANKNHFLDNLLAEGYDIIIYRSANSTETIEKNGVCLANFIQDKIINVKNNNEQLVVIGASMGGLTARYALTLMEKYPSSYPSGHQTRLFISLDSPQNGANVPLGMQYMIKNLNEDTFNSIAVLNNAEANTLNSPAAREMLLYHHLATSGETAQCHNDRNNFLSNLAAIGNFPKNCKTAAITLGSGNGTNQGFAAGATLINIPDTRPVFATAGVGLDAALFLILGMPVGNAVIMSNINWSIQVNAVPNQTEKSIYKEDISLDLCIPKVKVICSWYTGFVPIVFPYFDCHNEIKNRDIKVSNTLPLDNAPGSIKGWHNFKDFQMGLVAVAMNITNFANIDYNYDCFIPSYSALGLNNISSPHTNIINYLNNNSNVSKVRDYFYKNNSSSVSPFNFLYVENENDYHIYDNDHEGVFSNNLLSAMNYLIDEYDVMPSSISGPSTVSANTKYSLDNLPAGATVNWSISNNNDFTLTQSNSEATVTAKSYNGTATITANITYQGKNVTLNKSLSACSFEINGADVINGNYQTYGLKNTIPGILKYTWTASPNISFKNAVNLSVNNLGPVANTSNVEAQVYANSNYTYISVTALLGNGQQYSATKNLSSVLPPSGLYLTPHEPFILSDGNYQREFFADMRPECWSYDRSCFHWSISKGYIMIDGVKQPSPWDESPVNPGDITVDGLVPVKDFDNLVNALQSDDATVSVDGNNVNISSGDYNSTVTLSSPDLSGENLDIGNVKVAQSMSDPEKSVVVLELKKTDTDDSEVEQSVYAYITPLDEIDAIIVVGHPEPDPYNAACDWVDAVYPPDEVVTITCKFTYNGGEPLYAYWTILPNNNVYYVSYAPSIKTINVQPTQNNGESGTFNLIISNNSSVIGTYPINSTGQLMQIPVDFLPAGTYYVTITDKNGNIMDSQSLSIY